MRTGVYGHKGKWTGWGWGGGCVAAGGGRGGGCVEGVGGESWGEFMPNKHWLHKPPKQM